MKTTLYVRVAKDEDGSPRVRAGGKLNHKPIGDGGYPVTFWPTVAFALELEIPDDAFEQAEKVLATIEVPNPDVAAEVTVLA